MNLYRNELLLHVVHQPMAFLLLIATLAYNYGPNFTGSVEELNAY